MILLRSLGIVAAITKEEITEARSIINSKADCKALSDLQLEIIGEYYMEQMHPGESHELMHKMMGLKEGSPEEKQFHINLTKRLYCNEAIGTMRSDNRYFGAMMPIMNGGAGMMGNYQPGYRYAHHGYSDLLLVLLFALNITLVAWIAYTFMIRKSVTSETPLDILKKRLAQGEISKKQFYEVKKEIER